MLALLELPLLGYIFAPGWTPGAVDRFKAWIAGHGRGIATVALGAIGLILVVQGIIQAAT
jgi:Sap-like sulfolipid-1-addressing protein